MRQLVAILWVGLPTFKPRRQPQARPIADARGLFERSVLIARGREGIRQGHPGQTNRGHARLAAGWFPRDSQAAG